MVTFGIGLGVLFALQAMAHHIGFWLAGAGSAVSSCSSRARSPG